MQNREFKELKKSIGNKVKSSRQLNSLFESDCEILKIAGNKFLATSIDSISDEIELGLYKEIETWAWMAIMSSVSDLAASASTPLGITLSTEWKHGTDLEIQTQFFKAVHKACKSAKVPLLGGDSGTSSSHVFTSSIIGQSNKKPLMRTGAKAGDLLVLAHKKNVGVGPALAYRFLMNADESIMPEKNFRPMPSWELALKILPYAHASIDTSDGIAASVSILCELNKLGATLYWEPKINHPLAMRAMETLGLSPLFLWLGDHGDYQTLFVISEKQFSKIPKTDFKNLSVIGQLKKEKGTLIKFKDQHIPLPVDKITQVKRDLNSYLELVKDLKEIFAPYK